MVTEAKGVKSSEKDQDGSTKTAASELSLEGWVGMEGIPGREKSMRNTLQKQGVSKCFGETTNPSF